jgi:hypothetical protein
METITPSASIKIETATPSPQAILQSTLTPTETPYVTSTAPPPLSPLPLISPQPGLVFQNIHSAYDLELWSVGADGKLSYITNERDAIISDDQRWLVYQRLIVLDPIKNSMDGEVWVEDRVNGIARRLSAPFGCNIESDMFDWSSDGLFLFYFVHCEKNYNRDLWSLDLMTWQSANLSNTPDRAELCFFYSFDCAVFFQNDPGKILVASQPIEINTKAEMGIVIPRWESNRFITEIDQKKKTYRVLDDEQGVYAPPSVSPDGNAIAYDGGIILYKDGTKKKLNSQDFGLNIPAPAYEDSIDIVNPSWSPDGKKIAWDIAHIDGWNKTATGIFDVETEKGQILYTYSPYYWNITICVCETWHNRKLVWSPDSNWLAFQSMEWTEKEETHRMDMFDEEHSHILIFSRDGKEMFSMYGIEEIPKYPFWSLDGKWVAFGTINRDHNTSIAMVNVDEWKAYKVDLPFDSVRLVNWLNP